jgi:hypothetical protein
MDHSAPNPHAAICNPNGNQPESHGLREVTAIEDSWNNARIGDVTAGTM